MCQHLCSKFLKSQPSAEFTVYIIAIVLNFENCHQEVMRQHRCSAGARAATRPPRFLAGARVIDPPQCLAVVMVIVLRSWRLASSRHWRHHRSGSCVYIYVHTYTRTDTHTQTHTESHTHAQTHTYTHTKGATSTYIRTDSRTHSHLKRTTHTHVTCVRVRTHMHTRSHAHIASSGAAAHSYVGHGAFICAT